MQGIDYQKHMSANEIVLCHLIYRVTTLSYTVLDVMFQSKSCDYVPQKYFGEIASPDMTDSNPQNLDLNTV